MRIINRTGWRTDHLRAFAHKVADATLDPEHRKQLVVEFRNSRTRGVTGHAYYKLVRWSHGPMRKYGWCRYARITLPTGKLPYTRSRFLSKWQPEGGAATVEAKRVEWTADRQPNKRALASVLEHEMLHTVGQRHPGGHGNHTMRGHYDDATLANDRLAWADELPLDPA